MTTREKNFVHENEFLLRISYEKEKFQLENRKAVEYKYYLI